MSSSTDEKTENKTHFVTGIIYYKDGDDLTETFTTLHKFRKEYGLKYSKNRGCIYFSVNGEHLTELSKEQKFKISHFKSKSEYVCNQELADKLLAVRDSFIRMFWVETEGKVQFLSRTNTFDHNQLVFRIFKSISETFTKSNYYLVKTLAKLDTTLSKNENVEDQEHVENFEHMGQEGQRGARGARGTRGQRGARGERGQREQTEQTKEQQTDKVDNESQTGSGSFRGRGSFRNSSSLRVQNEEQGDRHITNLTTEDEFVKVVRNKKKYNKKTASV